MADDKELSSRVFTQYTEGYQEGKTSGKAEIVAKLCKILSDMTVFSLRLSSTKLLLLNEIDNNPELTQEFIAAFKLLEDQYQAYFDRLAALALTDLTPQIM